MLSRWNMRPHSHFGFIHTIETAFLTSGMLLSTLAMLVLVYIVLWFLAR